MGKAKIENGNLIESIDTIENEISEIIEVDEVEEHITILGTVSNCKRLNVRKAPSKDSYIVTEVSEDTQLMIDIEKSTNEWYSICTASGIEGFCMKDFITVNQ